MQELLNDEIIPKPELLVEDGNSNKRMLLEMSIVAVLGLVVVEEEGVTVVSIRLVLYVVDLGQVSRALMLVAVLVMIQAKAVMRMI